MIQPVCDVTGVAAASNHSHPIAHGATMGMLEGQMREFPCT
jgi:hypothetical protein